MVSADTPAPHIVDALIAERAPRLTRSALWPVVRPLLYAALSYRDARAMADAITPMSGAEAFAHVADLLALDVTAAHLERLPAQGRCMVIANHPTGMADGLAVHEAVRRVRADPIYFANADALRVSPRLGEVVIPVEWVAAKRTREKTRATLDAAKAAFEADRCVVMFPAGRLARVEKGALVDPPWATTAASLPRKYGAMIIPVHVSGPVSRLFHAFDRVSLELRDITLFHEMLNKRGKPFRLIVGRPIDPARLDPDPAKAVEALKIFTEQVLPRDPDAEIA